MASTKKMNLRDRLDDFTLDLSMLDLEEVPVKEIALIKKGTNLDLSINKITSLGNTFASLTHISRLDLSKNQLTVLPDNFGDLVLLKHLDLYSNKLTHLPLSVGKLKSLRWLDLKDNPLVPVLAEKAGQCLDPKQCQAAARTVVSFLAEMQQQVEEKKIALGKEREAALKKEEDMKQKDELKKKKKLAKAKQDKKKENGVRSSMIAADDKPTNIATDQKPVVKEGKKKPVQSSRSFFGTLLNIFGWLTFMAMTITSGFLVLRWVDYDKFLVVQSYSFKMWAELEKLLPKQVTDTLTQAVKSAQPKIEEISKQMNYGGQLINRRIHHIYSWIITHENSRAFLEHTRSLWDTMCTRIRDMYRTIS